MTPAVSRSNDPFDGVPLKAATSITEAELELAAAWASLAARRGAATGGYHVMVLRPFAL